MFQAAFCSLIIAQQGDGCHLKKCLKICHKYYLANRHPLEYNVPLAKENAGKMSERKKENERGREGDIYVSEYYK